MTTRSIKVQVAEIMDFLTPETGNVQVIVSDSTKVGGCNFCPVRTGPIYVLQGRKLTMQVRFCEDCIFGVVANVKERFRR